MHWQRSIAQSLVTYVSRYPFQGSRPTSASHCRLVRVLHAVFLPGPIIGHVVANHPLSALILPSPLFVLI